MATLDDLAEFFPSMIAVRANQNTPEALQKALVRDVETLRAKGVVGPLESAASMAFITKTAPPRISFNADDAVVQRLMMMRS